MENSVAEDKLTVKTEKHARRQSTMRETQQAPWWRIWTPGATDLSAIGKGL